LVQPIDQPKNSQSQVLLDFQSWEVKILDKDTTPGEKDTSKYKSIIPEHDENQKQATVIIHKHGRKSK